MGSVNITPMFDDLPLLEEARGFARKFRAAVADESNPISTDGLLAVHKDLTGLRQQAVSDNSAGNWRLAELKLQILEEAYCQTLTICRDRLDADAQTRIRCMEVVPKQIFHLRTVFAQRQGHTVSRLGLSPPERIAQPAAPTGAGRAKRPGTVAVKGQRSILFPRQGL